MTLYVFTDLDDTLFQTLRKCPPHDDTLSPIAMDRQGSPLSFTTAAQRTLSAWLSHGVVIPVTGRNSAALARVRLPFSSYRITSHGAMVVSPDGMPDGQWLTSLGERIALWQEHLQHAQGQLEQRRQHKNLAFRLKIVEDHGMPCYLSIKGEPRVLDELEPTLAEQKDLFVIHRNDENMALLPEFASKAQAVQFVMARLHGSGESPLTIGIGDSLSDLPFMACCDYAMIPRRSQIRERLWP